MGIVLIASFLLFGYLVTVIALDWTDEQWVACQVESAKPVKGNRYSTSVWKIGIDTTDCGRVLDSQAVNEDNVEQLAAAFEPEAYEFKFGLASQLAAEGWVPILSPSSSYYRPLQ